MPKSELADLTLAEHHRTEKAILVSEDGNMSKTCWLPFSQIEVSNTGKTVREHGTPSEGHRRVEQRVLDIVEVTLPQWLAEDKGLV